jgi:hypothetical protein
VRTARAGRAGRENAAAVRAFAVERAFCTLSAESAFEGADAGFAPGRIEVRVAAFAVGSKFKHIALFSFGFRMIDSNLKVFELIDESKNDTGLAKITDDANYERHIAKMALQKRFFDTELTEVKNRE